MNDISVAGVDVKKRFSDMCILTLENEVFARTKSPALFCCPRVQEVL